jgi:NAD+ synthase
MEQVIKNIRKIATEYMTKNNLQSMVLGVSGGLDSAVIAALMYPVSINLNIPLYCISLPSDTNKNSEIDRAEAICRNFSSNWANYYIDMDFQEVIEGAGIIRRNLKMPIISEHKAKIARGNIKARLRMCYLYDLAGVTNGLVLSTDNLSEYLTGFWTLHGDVGDIGFIQNLKKTEVYEIAQILVKELENKTATDAAQALLDCINATPTDGNGVSTSDMDQLGASSWKEVDTILDTYFNSTIGSEEHNSVLTHPVVLQYLKTIFKRQNPLNITREELFKGTEYDENR